jgi:hypothetical protein
MSGFLINNRGNGREEKDKPGSVKDASVCGLVIITFVKGFCIMQLVT